MSKKIDLLDPKRKKIWVAGIQGGKQIDSYILTSQGEVPLRKKIGVIATIVIMIIVIILWIISSLI